MSEVQRFPGAAVAVAIGVVLAGAFAVAGLVSVVTGDDGGVRFTATAAADDAPPAEQTLEVGGDGVSSLVTLVAPDARDGDELFVWRPDRGDPLWLLRQSGEWLVADDPWSATPELTEEDGVVVVAIAGVPAVAASITGVRVPAHGHVDVAGDEVVLPGDGATAMQEALASAQGGYSALDPLQRELVVSLLGRQTAAGAYTYRVRAGDGSEAVAILSVDYPSLSQLGDTGAGLYVTVDEVISCSDATRRTTCRPSSPARTPLGTAATVAGDPTSVDVTELEDGDWNGEPTRCLQISASAVGGPTPGRWCWLADGVVAQSVLDNGTVTTLEARSDLDPARLVPPAA